MFQPRPQPSPPGRRKTSQTYKATMTAVATNSVRSMLVRDCMRRKEPFGEEQRQWRMVRFSVCERDAYVFSATRQSVHLYLHVAIYAYAQVDMDPHVAT